MLANKAKHQDSIWTIQDIYSAVVTALDYFKVFISPCNLTNTEAQRYVNLENTSLACAGSQNTWAILELQISILPNTQTYFLDCLKAQTYSSSGAVSGGKKPFEL